MYEQPTKHHSSQQTYTTILSFFGCGMQSMGPATTRNDDLFIVILILAHAAHQSRISKCNIITTGCCPQPRQERTLVKATTLYLQPEKYVPVNV
jgi:hypothetical protein